MDPNRVDEIIAGVVMLTISLVGNAVNISVVVLIYRTPSFHNAFGIICASHLVADIGVLAIFSIWAAPVALLGLPDSMVHSYVGARMGQLAILLWYASTYGHIQVAVNRLLAIKYPTLYGSVFSTRRTKQMLAVFWLIAAANVVAYFWDECDFMFDLRSLTWLYAATHCGYIISFYMTLVHESALCAVVILIDTIAFLAIYKKAKTELRISEEDGRLGVRVQFLFFQKFLPLLGTVLRDDLVSCDSSRYAIAYSCNLSGKSNSFDETKMLRKNTNLYAQGCVQTVTFALAVLSFFVFSKFMKTKWGIFGTTTFVWEMAHALDGLILIAFQKKFRNLLRLPSWLWPNKAGMANVVAVSEIRSESIRPDHIVIRSADPLRRVSAPTAATATPVM